MLIRLEDIAHNFGTQELFFDVNLTVYEQDRIALIGQNGSGKTTLLNILSGEIEPTEGKIIRSNSLKESFLKQFRITNPELTLFDFVKEAVTDVEEVMIDKTVRSIVVGLGFDESQWTRKISTLSGGELTRLSLGKALAGNHNLLLLDEPTNHLDLYSIKWLQKYLKNYKGAIILISHDRDFLNGICNKYVEINNYKLWQFNGTYDKYIDQREKVIISTEARKKNLLKEIKRVENMIAMYRKFGTEKMVRQAIIRERTLKKLKEEYSEIEQLTQDRGIKIKIPEPTRTGHVVLKVENLNFSYEDKPLLNKISFDVMEGEKVSIIGKNGSGKSTLIKILSNKLKPLSGMYEWGYNIKVGYLDQVISSFDKSIDMLSETWKFVPDWPDYEVRKYLGRFGFYGDNVFKKIEDLSGGELTRLALAKIILTKPNVLVLDEPTNHLDIITVGVLEETLKEFKGAIILISHDERLIKNISNKFVFIKDGKSKVSKELNDFLEDIKNDSFKIEKRKKDTSNYAEIKKLKNRKKTLERRKLQIQNEANNTFERLDDLEKLMITHGNNYSKVMELMEEKEQLEKNLEKIELEEVEINEELNQMEDLI
ncbi:thiamine ABC transporter substrate-binding protein [Tepiditoga spiralis]|uniref:Thiamine ABC transporter substrate-binding protein n=1 Tax=Tepiditoga spiralis TaxID=2108365 RepID=A0A7G1G831_9BACT|nr:ABC-F family ATP-binding cassette domain-containing protein [Tepiditoga spiralis]BBE31063.1 thiamine ABC transporter substrate-binding protein [Tepiditoga spiralis]